MTGAAGDLADVMVVFDWNGTVMADIDRAVAATGPRLFTGQIWTGSGIKPSCSSRPVGCAHAIYVGDTEYDIAAAQRPGFAAAGLTGGQRRFSTIFTRSSSSRPSSSSPSQILKKGAFHANSKPAVATERLAHAC